MYPLDVQCFFIEPANFSGGKVRIDDTVIVHQIARVLRMRVSENFMALDNSGKKFICKISAVEEKAIFADVIQTIDDNGEQKFSVRLFQAMPKKPALFELIVQKCTEIGVDEFVPMRTEFSEREELPKKERILKIIKEAAEQSERPTLPILADVSVFSDVVKNPPNGLNIILHSRGGYPLLSLEKEKLMRLVRLNIFIGPEGGFSEDEVTLAKQNGFTVASLGAKILRTETAAICASAILLI